MAKRIYDLPCVYYETILGLIIGDEKLPDWRDWCDIPGLDVRKGALDDVVYEVKQLRRAKIRAERGLVH